MISVYLGGISFAEIKPQQGKLKEQPYWQKMSNRDGSLYKSYERIGYVRGQTPPYRGKEHTVYAKVPKGSRPKYQILYKKN